MVLGLQVEVGLVQGVAHHPRLPVTQARQGGGQRGGQRGQRGGGYAFSLKMRGGEPSAHTRNCMQAMAPFMGKTSASFYNFVAGYVFGYWANLNILKKTPNAVFRARTPAPNGPLFLVSVWQPAQPAASKRRAPFSPSTVASLRRPSTSAPQTPTATSTIPPIPPIEAW